MLILTKIMILAKIREVSTVALTLAGLPPELEKRAVPAAITAISLCSNSSIVLSGPHRDKPNIPSTASIHPTNAWRKTRNH